MRLKTVGSGRQGRAMGTQVQRFLRETVLRGESGDRDQLGSCGKSLDEKRCSQCCRGSECV